MKLPTWLARGKNARRAVEGALVGLVIGAVSAIVFASGTFRKYELTSIDSRMDRFANAADVSKDIVVLAIDDETVRWKEDEGIPLPYPRETWGTLVSMLSSLGPKAIVFDIAFADRRESATRTLFDEAFSSGNVALGDAAWRSGKVVIGIHTIEQKKNSTAAEIDGMTGRNPVVDQYLEERLPSARLLDGAQTVETIAVNPEDISNLIRPEEFVLTGSRVVGYVDVAHVRDSDGALRRFAPLTHVAGHFVPELSVAGLVAATATTSGRPAWIHPEVPRPGVLAPLPPIEQTATVARLPGGYEVPLLENGTAWIRWRGLWLKDERLKAQTRSAKFLLANATVQQWEDWGNLSPKEEVQAELDRFFRGRIVLIGFTIQGEASDFTQTPFGPQPGVFRYASTLDTILSGDYLRSPTASLDYALTIGAAIVTGIAGFSTADAFRRRSRRPTLIGAAALVPGVALLGAYYGLTQMLFMAGWIVLQLPALASIGLVAFVCAVTSFALAQRESLDEQKRKEHFFNLAAQGLGPQVLDELLKEGEDAIPKAGGQRKNLTLYFSDIAGFTTISEKLEPIQLVEILNEYFERVSRILVNKHHGYLDKFIGDAVMASWGGFNPDPEGALRACRAALDARDLIEQFSADLVSRGIPPLKTRIGLNSGTAVAAWVGLPGQRWYYTAFGDTVNLASRLEGANKAYGTTIMLGPLTYEDVKQSMLARELDLVRVKGKKIPVKVYELMGRAEDPLPKEREIKQRYEAALVKFRARDFTGAGADFEALIGEFGDSPSKTYRQYCDERLKEPPPPDWDGSNELHEK